MNAADLFRHPVVLAALGGIIGSFLNVVIWRVPRRESLVTPPSRCPSCEAAIRPWDNIPMLSWLMLRGCCRKCSRPISPRYPAVELLTAVLFVVTNAFVASPLALVIALAFGSAMIVVTFIDLDHRIIPDGITLPGTIIGLAAAFLGVFGAPREAILGVLLGGGGLFAVAAGYRAATGRDGLGGGDIKLLAMVGAFLGPSGALLTILLGSVAGTLFACIYMLRSGAGRTAELPFGTFLAPAAVVALLVGSRIVESYSGHVLVTSPPATSGPPKHSGRASTPERTRSPVFEDAPPTPRAAKEGSLLPFVGTAILFLLVVIALRLAGSLRTSLENEIGARLRISASLTTDALPESGLDPRDPDLARRLEDIRRATSVSDIALYDGGGQFLGGTSTEAGMGAGIPRRIRLGTATAEVDPSLRAPERDGGGGLTLVVPLAHGAGAVITRVDREGQGSLPAVDFLFNLAKALAGVITAAGLLILLRWIAGGGDTGRSARKTTAPSASDVDVVLGTMKEVMTTLKDSETHYRDRSRAAEADAEYVRRTNELILESIGSGLIAFDGLGRVTLCNPAAEQILGVPARAIRGKRVDDVFDVHDRMRRLAVDIRDFGVAGPREEFERPSAAGDALWLGVSSSVLVDAEGIPRGGILLVDDLTETKRLQEAMGIKDRLSAVGEMSAGLAHEIKNSLHSLLGYANLLRDDAKGEPPLPVQGILTEVRSLENLVKGILEFSRPSRLMRAPVDLNRLVRETADAVAETARGRAVTLQLELDDAIPPVAVDFESVKRVFMNCALNAIEAMEAGGILTITTRPAELTEALDGVKRARAVRIAFRDTGPGIPESERQRIFTPFFTTKREGHGLGLALVHKTVTDHGGRVQLHSREQVGTEFVILLPVEERA